MGSRTQQRRERDAGRDECQVILATTRSDPNGGVDPHRRRRRQSLDAAVGPHDRAGAEKANAGDDLRRDATGIAERPRHLDRHEREQRRADGDEDVGPQPGILLPQLTLEAQRSPEERRGDQTPDQFEVGDRWHIGCSL